MWLSGLSASLQTKGMLVRFPVGAHAWVVGQAPGEGPMRGRRLQMNIIEIVLTSSHAELTDLGFLKTSLELIYQK